MDSETNNLHDDSDQTRSAANHFRQRQPLQSRSEIHRKKKKKKKSKVKYPILKLLSLFFILLPITIYTVYHYSDDFPLAGIGSNIEHGFETIEIDEDASVAIDQKNDKKEKRVDNKETTHNQNSGEGMHNINEGEENQPNSKKFKIIDHTVQPQETIDSISIKYYKSKQGIPLIQQWNNLEGNDISAGQKLKIPLKK
jgi:LysM repeat protein